MTADATLISYWLLQYQTGDPESASIEHAPAGSATALSRSMTTSEVKKDDIAFIWRAAGSDSGLKGWGTVTDGIALGGSSSPAGGGPSGLRIGLSLPTAIPRSDLAGLPSLSDAPLIRQPQTGALFRLSAEQAWGIAEFLRGRNLPAPHIAPRAVADLIGRRFERELLELRSLLLDLSDDATARRMQQDVEESGARLRTDGVLDVRVLEYLDRIVADLEPVVAHARQRKAGVAESLHAARARMLSDSGQLAALLPHIGLLRDIELPRPITFKKPDGPESPGARVVENLSPTAVAPGAPKDPVFRWWEEKDLLGIGSAVNNLARYIAHEGLVPPRAIGVFGDWGSGKTFFIEALQSQIALLASQSRDALKDNRTTVFCSHVVQIEFNAWHYVESNLWASLAAHVFERLYLELERRAREEGGNPNVDGLFQQFAAYTHAVAEQTRLQELVKGLAVKRDEATKRKQEANQSVRRRLTVASQVLRSKLAGLAEEKLGPKERAQFAELLKAGNMAELREAAGSATELAMQSQRFAGQVRAQVQWWGGLQFTIFCVGLTAVVVGLPLAVPWVLGRFPGELLTVVTVIGGYCATAAGVLGWLSRNGRQLLTGARKVQDILDETRAEVEREPDPALDSARRNLEAAESELQLIEQQVVEQRGRLAKLTNDLDPTQLGARLREFLEDRVKTGAYQQHLGLVSLVRKDFEGLYGLMRRHWESRKSAVPVVVANVKNALGKTEEARVPFIERIVLYIDDLDRCPENRVVEVLQAVHLMLGLPLFVVVVAVDVRWVGQSIRKYYGQLVGEASRSTAGEIDGAASADDYLEKIFQIPYRINPIEPDVRRELLGGLLREPYLSVGGAGGGAPARVVTQQELVPKELSLYPEEQQTIQELYDCVGTSPRRVRRFLDVYRLMRAGMEEGEVHEVLSSRQYIVILSLFAMLSGAPRLAPRVIELLGRESLRYPAEDPPMALGFRQKSLEGWVFDALAADAGSDAERGVIRRTLRQLDERKLSRDDLVVGLRRWIPEIARYSFREVRTQNS